MSEAKKNKKYIIIGIPVIVILAVIIGLLIYNKLPTVQMRRQLDLGNKYLNELNYEQAVAAFNKALEINPSNNEAEEYLKTAYEEWINSEIEAGRINIAQDVLDAALALFPDDSTFTDMQFIISSGDSDRNGKSNDELIYKATEEDEPEYDDSDIISEMDFLVANGLMGLETEEKRLRNEFVERIIRVAAWFENPGSAGTSYEGAFFISKNQIAEITAPTIEILEKYIDLLDGKEKRFTFGTDRYSFEMKFFDVNCEYGGDYGNDSTNYYTWYNTVFLSDNQKYEALDIIYAYRIIADAYLLQGDYEQCMNTRLQLLEKFGYEDMCDKAGYVVGHSHEPIYTFDPYGRITRVENAYTNEIIESKYGDSFMEIYYSPTTNDNDIVSCRYEFDTKGICTSCSTTWNDGVTLREIYRVIADDEVELKIYDGKKLWLPWSYVYKFKFGSPLEEIESYRHYIGVD